MTCNSSQQESICLRNSFGKRHIQRTHTHTHSRVEYEIMNEVCTCWQHVDLVTFYRMQYLANSRFPSAGNFCFPSERKLTLFVRKWWFGESTANGKPKRKTTKKNVVFLLIGISECRVAWNGVGVEHVKHEQYFIFNEIETSFTYSHMYIRSSFEHNRMPCYNDSTMLSIFIIIIMIILSILICVMFRSLYKNVPALSRATFIFFCFFHFVFFQLWLALTLMVCYVCWIMQASFHPDAISCFSLAHAHLVARHKNRPPFTKAIIMYTYTIQTSNVQRRTADENTQTEQSHEKKGDEIVPRTSTYIGSFVHKDLYMMAPHKEASRKK